MLRKALTLVAVSVIIAGCSTTYVTKPVITAGQQLRYNRGTPTTLSEMKSGSVEVSPLGVDKDKRLVFGVAAFNGGSTPQNFGVENLSLSAADGSNVQLLTADELIHRAKRKAAWAAFFYALAGAANAYAATATANTTTMGTVYTPNGPATFVARTYNPALAYAGANAAAAQTQYNIAAVESRLDQTISSVQGQVLQTTTVDPGSSYGGDAVADGLGGDDFPHNLVLTVHWNNEDHIFRFTMTEGE